ncbi:hypothetical protein [Rhizobium sp. BT03]|uniref:hypothetical protein n=1 Tax=Rhizobium sp. BT03 TaxID=3045156 RepID=UPI0024B3DD9B|nr:hypothetical protein [Rhizobium sp. BT03]WHO71807.1 DUF1353 domain-containing protein [Rhizobium sp. BT03]
MADLAFIANSIRRRAGRFKKSVMLTAASMTAVLAGCTTIDFGDLRAGTFSGTLIVMWVGEGDGAGDGKFVFVPDPDAPLTFLRPGAKSAPIIPSVMYTDGGSVPKIVQPFKGFNPWGYAPAYMIHDWIFTARHCLDDGRRDPIYTAVEHIDFHDSAVVLGEAIHTLMKKNLVSENDVAKQAITEAVNSPIAARIWKGHHGQCEDDAVKPEHLREIEKFLAGSTTDEAKRRNLNIAGAANSLRRPSRAVEVGRVTF